MAGQIRVDEITNEAGTGSPSFPNQITPASLGTGTPSSSNFLRGDGQWATAGFSGAQTVTSANNVTLTASSPQVLNLTMTAENRTVVLPNATTMAAGTPVFLIINSGWVTFAVATSDGNEVALVAPGVSRRFTLTNNSTVTGIWAVQDSSPPFAARIGNDVIESFGADGITQLSDTTFLVSRITATTVNTPNTGVLTRTIEHRVATLSNGALTYGSPVSVTYNGNASAGEYLKLSDDVFLVGYIRIESNNTSGSFRARALRVSGNSIAAGAEVTINSRSLPNNEIAYYTVSLVSGFQNNAIAGHWHTNFTSFTSGRVRGLVVNGDNSISLGADVDPGNNQHLAEGLRLAPGVFLCRMDFDWYYGSGTKGLRVISLSGTTVTFGTVLAGDYNTPRLRVDDNTAIGTNTVITRSGTTVLTPTALNRSLVFAIPINSTFAFDNAYLDVASSQAQQIIGTTISQPRSVTFAGTIGWSHFKTAADEFISFFTGANLRYNRFKVFP